MEILANRPPDHFICSDQEDVLLLREERAKHCGSNDEGPPKILLEVGSMLQCVLLDAHTDESSRAKATHEAV